MTVHLFGAGSSPGCCNFALKKTADDHEQEFGVEPANFLRKDFYVDDGLKSAPSTSHAKELIRKNKEMCRRGGFKLHKFTSNKREVIEAIPVEDRAKGIKEVESREGRTAYGKSTWCGLVYPVRRPQVPDRDVRSPLNAKRNPVYGQQCVRSVGFPGTSMI